MTRAVSTIKQARQAKQAVTLGEQLSKRGLCMDVELVRLYSDLKTAKERMEFWAIFAPFVAPKLKAIQHSIETVEAQTLRWQLPGEDAANNVIDIADYVDADPAE